MNPFDLRIAFALVGAAFLPTVPHPEPASPGERLEQRPAGTGAPMPAPLRRTLAAAKARPRAKDTDQPRHGERP
jgi:hypothetical protein